MEELVLDRGIKKIAIKDDDTGELIVVLKINVADAQTAEKFADVIHNLEGISKKCDEEAEAWRTAHPDPEEAKNDISLAVEINRIRVKYIRQIIEEIDNLFGEGTVAAIYGDIVPDEEALVDFIEKIIPVMSKLFNKRYEISRKRYSSGRKGAKA